MLRLKLPLLFIGIFLVKIVLNRTLISAESAIALVDGYGPGRREKMAPKDGLDVDLGFNICLTLVQIRLQH